MTDRIRELTKLVLKGKIYPEIQKVEYDRQDCFLPEAVRDGKEIYEYVTAQKPVLTEFSAFTGLLIFDGSIPGDAMTGAGHKNLQMLVEKFYNKPINNLSTFEWKHATADYNRVIRKGIRGLLEEIETSKRENSQDVEAQNFLYALEMCAKAMIEWAHKCSRESRIFASSVKNPEYKSNL